MSDETNLTYEQEQHTKKQELGPATQAVKTKLEVLTQRVIDGKTFNYTKLKLKKVAAEIDSLLLVYGEDEDPINNVLLLENTRLLRGSTFSTDTNLVRTYRKLDGVRGSRHEQTSSVEINLTVDVNDVGTESFAAMLAHEIGHAFSDTILSEKAGETAESIRRHASSPNQAYWTYGEILKGDIQNNPSLPHKALLKFLEIYNITMEKEKDAINYGSIVADVLEVDPDIYSYYAALNNYYYQVSHLASFYRDIEPFVIKNMHAEPVSLLGTEDPATTVKIFSVELQETVEVTIQDFLTAAQNAQAEFLGHTKADY